MPFVSDIGFGYLYICLFSSLKRQVLCVEDRLKMVKHMAWATTAGPK